MRPAVLIAFVVGLSASGPAMSAAYQWQPEINLANTSPNPGFPAVGRFNGAALQVLLVNCPGDLDAYMVNLEKFRQQGQACETAPGLLSLVDFARQQDVLELSNAIQSNLTAIIANQQRLHADAIEFSWTAAALSGAMLTVLPQEGKANHFAVGFAAGGDVAAVSFNYSYVHRDLDFHANISTTGDHYLAKGGIGISW